VSRLRAPGGDARPKNRVHSTCVASDFHDGTDIPGGFRQLTEALSLRAPAAVRVDPSTPRSHRSEGDEPVEMWAVSRWIERSDSTKIDGFWDASPQAGRNAR
jgi:hypothetical protein